MRRLARLGFLTYAAVAACSPGEQGAAIRAPRTAAPTLARPPDANAILRRLTERYRTAKTYADEGIQRSTIRRAGNARFREERTAFRTAFVRATGAFFFDYEQTSLPAVGTPTRGVIWRTDSEQARRWWTVKDDIRETTLETAIGGFAGVSGGTAYFVPSMLVGFGDHPRSGASFEVVGDELVSGVRCVKLSARETKDERETTMWISTAEPALRRIQERAHIVREALSREEAAGNVPPSASEDVRRVIIDDYMRPSAISTESITDYEPVFDRPIDPAHFQFTPPETP